jgi:hypothetical protein
MTPRATSATDRQPAWTADFQNGSPRALRDANENTIATPTRNENDGWIRSCSEHPTHSTWVVWNCTACQNGLSGNCRATAGSRSTSASMRNMTNPR